VKIIRNKSSDIIYVHTRGFYCKCHSFQELKGYLPKIQLAMNYLKPLLKFAMAMISTAIPFSKIIFEKLYLECQEYKRKGNCKRQRRKISFHQEKNR